jgi:hypothetical protein
MRSWPLYGHDSRDGYAAPGVEATLVTARRLLNNPSSMHASPSATEQ